MEKTALQELIEYLDNRIKGNEIPDAPVAQAMAQSPYKAIRNKAASLLEKERQQIEKAYAQGNLSGYSEGLLRMDLPSYQEPENQMTKARDYFNETYKQ